MEYPAHYEELQQTIETFFAVDPARTILPSLNTFQVAGRTPSEQGIYAAQGKVPNGKYGALSYGVLGRFQDSQRAVILKRVGMILRSENGEIDINAGAQFQPYESHAYTTGWHVNVGGLILRCATNRCVVQEDGYSLNSRDGLRIAGRAADKNKAHPLPGFEFVLDVVAAHSKSVVGVNKQGVLLDRSGKGIKNMGAGPATLEDVSDNLRDAFSLLARAAGTELGRPRRVAL